MKYLVSKSLKRKHFFVNHYILNYIYKKTNPCLKKWQCPCLKNPNLTHHITFSVMTSSMWKEAVLFHVLLTLLLRFHTLCALFYVIGLFQNNPEQCFNLKYLGYTCRAIISIFVFRCSSDYSNYLYTAFETYYILLTL